MDTALFSQGRLKLRWYGQERGSHIEIKGQMLQAEGRGGQTL
jgi:hypothetical protein